LNLDNQQSLFLRTLTPEDVHNFRRLRISALKESPESFGAHFSEWQYLPLDEIIRRMGCQSESFVLGAFAAAERRAATHLCGSKPGEEQETEPKLVGVAGFRRHKGIKEAHCGTVWGVYIAPDSRGRGIAQALLIELLAKARQLDGLEEILLTVSSHNRAARRLYEGLKFKPYGFKKHALKISDKYVDEFLMSLDLSSA
jgi:RimJ/RimL family protein N-acetyltransferase